VTFPDGSDPSAHGLVAEAAIAFGLTADQPNNSIHRPDGSEVLLGSVRRRDKGEAVAALFIDFKRHDMGAGLVDQDDPLGIPGGHFLGPVARWFWVDWAVAP